MAAPLIISISHALGKEEALRRLQPGLKRMTAGLPVLTVEQEAWSGDHMEFRIKALGQSASGAMDVADDYVRIELRLPWLLQRLAEGIRDTIQARGRILLENKPRD